MKFLKGSNEDQAGTILAFGNPNLGNPIYDLPGAEKEAIAITREQPNFKLFTGRQATETVQNDLENISAIFILLLMLHSMQRNLSPQDCF